VNTPKSARLPGATSPAGDASSPGQAGPRTPERVPPARPTFRTCECKHLELLHNLTDSKRRTACSVSTGPKATPCGCRSFAAATEPTPGDPS